MTPEPKRLDSVEHVKYDEVERLMEELERRQFDRRRGNRWKQISQWIGVVGFSLTMGSCAAAVAARMGWRVLGTPDDVTYLQASVSGLTTRVVTLEQRSLENERQMQFLVVARCMELTEREAILSRAIVDCPSTLRRAGVVP